MPIGWKERLLGAGLPLAGLCGIWLLPPVSTFFARIVKLAEMRTPYTVLLFALLAVFVLCLRAEWVRRTRGALVILVGALAGLIASILAIFMANLFLPRGIERTVGSFQRWGLDLLVTDLAMSLLLGGWLLGALLLASYRVLLSTSLVTR